LRVSRTGSIPTKTRIGYPRYGPEKDLLDIKQWKQIPILSPRQFYDLIRQNSE